MDATTTVGLGSQQMHALRRANDVRLARAELKRKIADGRVRAGDVILTSPWEAHSMPVVDLLVSQYRWGHTRANRFLTGVALSETKTIGSLTERQRRRLADQLANIDGLHSSAKSRRPSA